MSSQNALYLLIDERLKRDELKLPGLPETAEQVRNATMDPDCNLHDLSHIIQQDTVLSARLIRLANSAYLGGRNKAELNAGVDPYRHAAYSYSGTGNGDGTGIQTR